MRSPIDGLGFSRRGMSRWHDWIGGYLMNARPLSRLSIALLKMASSLTKIFDCSTGYGCNEFVFFREAPSGTLIDVPPPGGWSMALSSVVGFCHLLTRLGDHWTAVISNLDGNNPAAEFYIIRNDTILRQVSKSEWCAESATARSKR